jgi:ABC-2 type transport system permease protein
MLRFLIEKEFKRLFRNPFLPRLILILPVMMLLIMPWAANQEVKDLRISVVDNDRSSLSIRLINKIAASDNFILTSMPASNDEALRGVDRTDVDIVLEIQRDFERNFVREGVADVMMQTNAVNGMKAGLGSSYLSMILMDFSEEINRENGLADRVVARNAPAVATKYLFNKNLDYKVFMLPALMVMLLTLMCGFLPALNIVEEKEGGTIEQMNVTPVGKMAFVLAKLIPYWIIGYVVLAIGLGISALIYGLYPAGSLLTIFLFATVYVLVVSGFGLVISNYSATLQQAMFMMFFFIMIFILMSGLFTPVSSMPDWAQTLTYINPLRYFMEVMRAVYLKSSALRDLLPQLGALCVFAAILIGWAGMSYRKSSY